MGAKSKVLCYEKEDKVWLNWGTSGGYFDGWAPENLHISKDMTQVIGVDPGGKVKVWSTSGIRQLPQG